jgi:hypothetical protein
MLFAFSTPKLYAVLWAPISCACARRRFEDERRKPRNRTNYSGRGHPPEIALSPDRKHPDTLRGCATPGRVLSRRAQTTIDRFCSALHRRRRSGPDSTSTRLIAPSLAPVQVTSLAPVQTQQRSSVARKAAATGGLPRVTLYVLAAPSGSRGCRRGKLEPGSPFGPNLRAFALYLRFTHAISFERLSHLFSDLVGLDISEGALVNLLDDSREAFARQASLIRAKLLAGTHYADIRSVIETARRRAIGALDAMRLTPCPPQTHQGEQLLFPDGS